MTPHHEPQLLWTTAETARAMSVTVERVRQLIKDGKIRAIRLSGNRPGPYRVVVKSVHEFCGLIEPQRRKPTQREIERARKESDRVKEMIRRGKKG